MSAEGAGPVCAPRAAGSDSASGAVSPAGRGQRGAFGSSEEVAQPGALGAAGGGAAEPVVLYKGFGMVPFRVLVRLKVFQLAGVAGLAIPINSFLGEARNLFSRACLANAGLSHVENVFGEA